MMMMLMKWKNAWNRKFPKEEERKVILGSYVFHWSMLYKRDCYICLWIEATLNQFLNSILNVLTLEEVITFGHRDFVI